MLLTTHKEPFSDDNYIFEPKYDGWRVLLHKDGEHIEAFTRHGNLITAKLPELSEVKHRIHARTAILDCEAVCIRDDRPNFDDMNLRGRLSNQARIEKATITYPVMFAVFDVLQTTSSHLHQPILERKEILNDIIEPAQNITPTIYTRGDGISLFRIMQQQGWEGVVAKLTGPSSAYHLNARSKTWKKIKTWKSLDVVILGYRQSPFALVVGEPRRDGTYRPLAEVEFGFRPEHKTAFRRVIPQLHTSRSKDVQWVEPRLSCRVQYIERTDRGHIRTVKFTEFLTNTHQSFL